MNAAAGRSRIATLAWSPGGSKAAARSTTGRAAGAVRYTTVAYRIGDSSPAMIPVVRATGLGVSSTSIAQTCPAYGLPSMLGQWISASGTCSRRPAAGWSARSRRSECHHACPSAQVCPAASHSRAASTARMCASRASAGRPAGKPSPVAAIPSLVSQHQPGPGPSRPVATYPAWRHRAVIFSSRFEWTRSASASRSYGTP